MQTNDEYFHSDSSIIYTSENIPGPMVSDDPDCLKIYENFNLEYAEGCKCTDECSLESDCFCILKFGKNYKPDSEDSLNYVLNYNDIGNSTIHECHNKCCCTNCGNRVVQRGPRANLEIVPVENKGYGVITKEIIPASTFICEYAGEVLTHSEATKRFQANYSNDKMNYIFCLREHFVDEVMTTYIDPSKFGNIGRYLNHSCSPNCFLVPVRVNTAVPRLSIFSMTEIAAGEEVTFDYGDDCVSPDEADNKFVSCHCGSENCRGRLPYCS